MSSNQLEHICTQPWTDDQHVDGVNQCKCCNTFSLPQDADFCTKCERIMDLRCEQGIIP